jgi:Ca2+-binding RTX toxin-like protein
MLTLPISKSYFDSLNNSITRSQIFSDRTLPFVGVIDTEFSVDDFDLDGIKICLGSNLISANPESLSALSISKEHGSKVLQILKSAQTQALWLGQTVGSGRWAESLVEFVNAIKAFGHPNAVINLSFDLVQVNPDGRVTTRFELTASERAAIAYAQQHSVLLVVAAGNQGGIMSALGQASQAFDNIITVGAATGLSRAPYSSYGDGLTLLANGAGTSAAAARVTKAISQVWAANPNLSYCQIAHILKTTAINLNLPGWDTETGFGLLNLLDAIDLAVSTTPIPKLVLSDCPCPAFEPWVTEGTMLERPAWFGEDVWNTTVNVLAFPFKTAAAAAKFLTDKAGDGIKAALSLVLPDAVGELFNEFIDSIGEKVQGIVEREIQYIKNLPSRVGRTAEDLFSDELWKNFGGWALKNSVNIAELWGIPERAETLADLIKLNTRPLTDREKTLARSVFGNSINLEIVQIDEWSYGSLIAYAVGNDATEPRPFTTFNTINSWWEMDDATLIHELTHVWQYQHGGAIYIPEALGAQQSSGFTGTYPPGIDEGNIPGYRYGGYTELEKRMAHGGKLSGFTYGNNNTPNHEQQATIVEDYYKIKTDGKTSNDQFLPIYAYFVREVSTRSLKDLIPAPYGLVLGTNSPNFLQGNSRNEVIVGLAGNDTIDGGSGDDRMYGGFGNDSYVVNSSKDVIIEYPNEGVDQIRASVSYTLGDNLENLILTGNARSNGTGNALGNTITGNDADNTLLGLDGNDTLNGLGGDDRLEGGPGHDTLIGGEGDDSLVGGAGKDSIDGGGGIDTVSYISSSNSSNLGVSVNLLTNVAFDGIDSLDTLKNIENVTGSRFADRLIGNEKANGILGSDGDDIIEGNAGDDVLFGGAGNDRLIGGDGNDFLDGGTGNDTMLGGNGDDTYLVDSTADTVIDFPGTGIDTVRASVNWDLRRQNPTSPNTNTGLDNLTLIGNARNGTGNELNNIITGNKQDNTLYGMEGNDILYGMEGNDRLIGGDGNDVLDGGTGNDTMLGGNGNDTYLVDSIADTIIDSLGTGTETVIASVNWDLRRQNPTSSNTNTGLDNLTLTGNARNGIGNELNNIIIGNKQDNTLYGMEGNDTLYGRDGNDRLIGGDGSDVLNGGTGNDTMQGGNGDDTYLVDSIADTIIDSLGTGTETVIASVNWDLRRQNPTSPNTKTGIDKLTLTGNARNGTGNELNNTITGNELDNTLYGMEGNDTLYGKGGNDRLIGGNGNDRLVGGDGNDTLLGGLGQDTFVFSSSAEGVDQILDFSMGDKIQIASAGFAGGLAVGTLRASQFSLGSVATTSSQRFIYNTNSGNLLFDADGVGAVFAPQQIATLSDAPMITHNAIVII